jgi:two-component system response regulator YesN
MNLKVLLVDDELFLLNNLKSVVPWNDLGIDVVGLARNGVEALALVEAEKPHIIMCDIRMPVMDGITFLEEVRKIDGDVEIMMLTGYQDFEYARSALKHRVVDYILKPINYDELTRTIEKMAIHIRTKQLKLQEDSVKWGKVAKLAYEKILLEMLMDYSAQSEGLLLSLEDEGLRDVRFVMMLVDLDDYAQKSVQWTKADRKLWNFAVKNVLQDALQQTDLTSAVLQTREGEWCVLLQYDASKGDMTKAHAEEWAGMLQKAVKDNVKLDVSVGYDARVIRHFQLSSALNEARRTLNLTFGLKQGIQAVQAKRQDNEIQFSLWTSIEDIIYAVKQSDSAKAEAALREFNAGLLAASEQSIVQTERILHYFVLHVLREMRELDVLPVQEEEKVWKRLQFSMSLKDLMQALNQLVDQCLQTVSTKKSSEVLMLDARNYMDRNLSSDLGIEELADYLGISCSYFSMLFKQHFDETFLEYLTRSRVEFAKSMLLSSDQSITKIGKMVGYAERRYFTKVFHKITGCSPSEYRERHLGGEQQSAEN